MWSPHRCVLPSLKWHLPWLPADGYDLRLAAVKATCVCYLKILTTFLGCLQTGVTYDWRLSVPMLEQRDGYFTKLKATIEITCKLQNQKVRAKRPSAMAAAPMPSLRQLEACLPVSAVAGLQCSWLQHSR